MFDISRLGINNLDAGAQMEVVSPATGTVALDEKGKPLTITLLGRLSEKYQAVVRAQINKRLASASRSGAKPSTVEEADKNQLEQLVAATVGWSFDKMDGKPFPCNEENARLFWAALFLEDDTNFLRI
jgi:hypothetical protein